MNANTSEQVVTVAKLEAQRSLHVHTTREQQRKNIEAVVFLIPADGVRETEKRRRRLRTNRVHHIS